MLLTVDVGNTEIKLGVYADGDTEPRHHWRLMTDARRTGDEFVSLLAQLFAFDAFDPKSIRDVVIASVVPRVETALVDCIEHLVKRSPRFLRSNEQTIMSVVTDRPAEVGSDLVALAIGARARYGAPLIVVSYGTATVFTAIDEHGAFAGAAIAPGIATSVDALIGRTAKLPQVALVAPKTAIGRDTMHALQSGIMFGVVGQTQALVQRFRDELGSDARVIATGGLADIVASHCDIIDAVMPHASFEGLRIFADRC